MLKNRFFLANIIFSIVAIQAMIWGLFLKRSVLPPEVPLFYTREWGETQLTSPKNLWILPFGAAVILIINTFLANFFFRREKLFSKILILTSSLVSLLSALALLRILNLVIP